MVKSSPRIIFVNRLFHPDHSASSQLLSDLVFSLADQSEIIVVTSRQSYDDAPARLTGQETVKGVRVYRIASTRFGRGGLSGRLVDLISFDAATWLTLAILLRRDDVVVVKTDPPMLSVVVHWAAGLKGARRVNWLQDVYPEVAAALGVRGVQGFPGRMLRVLRDASLIGARSNVVLGQRMAAHLRARGVPTDRIHVIANWADEETIRPIDHNDNPLRRAWGLFGQPRPRSYL